MRNGSVAAAGVSLGLLVPATLLAQTPAQAHFVTVDQGPDELDADSALASQLAPLLVTPPKAEGYKAVIDDLVADNQLEGTVARVTPYAFVVAEMLGAKMELIATYRSQASGTTTYGAYLVVRRAAVPSPGSGVPPTLAQVREYLQRQSDRGSPAKFVYHDRFSTSSYFLPSLYFRRQRVFSGKPDASEKGTAAIKVERLEDASSSDLVAAVAESRADMASVWDGTRSKFLQGDAKLRATADQVWFIRLQANLPDDLLVATHNARALVGAIQSRLTAQDRKGSYPAGSDVLGWVLWSDNDAEEARAALSELRRQASAAALPVIVDVRSSSDAPASDAEIEAVRQSLRLAGTELVATCESSNYRNVDIVWELARIHDAAVRMTVHYDDFRYTPTGQDVTQQFDISFTNLSDLTRRVSLLITTRMHRIRPVWLYWDTVPTVIRDVAFDPSTPVPVQDILWKNPRRNDYTVLERKVAQLERSDFNKLELDGADLSFDPMGRRGVRVLLVRPNRERPLFQALTVAFVVLFALAALGLAWDAWRMRQGRPLAVAGVGSDRVDAAVALVPGPQTAVGGA